MIFSVITELMLENLLCSLSTEGLEKLGFLDKFIQGF